MVYIRNEKVAAKDTAAEWVLPKLPPEFMPLLKTARDAYLGTVRDNWNSVEGQTVALVNHMKQQLEKLLQTK